MKQEFDIPEGTKLIVSQEGDKVVIEFAPKKFDPKDGDIIVLYNESLKSKCIGIFEKYTNKNKSVIMFFAINYIGKLDCNVKPYGFTELKPATDSEKQQLFDALEKAGYTWNAKEKKVEKLRWKPKNGGLFYFFDSELNPVEATFCDGYIPHLKRIKISNCFKTQQECQAYCDYMKQKSKEYHDLQK